MSTISGIICSWRKSANDSGKVYVSFRNIARDLGIKRFNPHSNRHRVAQGWLDQGANLELVRVKAGTF